MNTLLHVPPGFRFHPTDEELVDYYLRKKISSRRIDLDVIKDVELYNIEPWDLQDKVDCKLYLRQRLLLIIDDLVLIANEICNVGREDEKEWYIFSHKDKKYPTGSRTNRATRAGFWKATGRDKAIYTKHSELIIGMRKTLVYYKGRAPNGQKSDWIMHEYRLQTHENDTPQEEGWVVCRVFKKRIAIVRGMNEHESPCWYDEPMSFMPNLDSPNQSSLSNFPHHNLSNFPCKKEVDHNLPYQNHFLHLPILESQKLLQSVTTATSSMPTFALDINQQASSFEPSAAKLPNIDEQQQQLSDQNMFLFDNNNNNDELTDWGVFDKYVASQLSQENALKQEFIDPQNAPTSTSSSQIEMWK